MKTAKACLSKPRPPSKEPEVLLVGNMSQRFLHKSWLKELGSRFEHKKKREAYNVSSAYITKAGGNEKSKLKYFLNKKKRKSERPGCQFPLRPSTCSVTLGRLFFLEKSLAEQMSSPAWAHASRFHFLAS